MKACIIEQRTILSEDFYKDFWLFSSTVEQIIFPLHEGKTLPEMNDSWMCWKTQKNTLTKQDKRKLNKQLHLFLTSINSKNIESQQELFDFIQNHANSFTFCCGYQRDAIELKEIPFYLKENYITFDIINTKSLEL